MEEMCVLLGTIVVLEHLVRLLVPQELTEVELEELLLQAAQLVQLENTVNPLEVLLSLETVKEDISELQEVQLLKLKFVQQDLDVLQVQELQLHVLIHITKIKKVKLSVKLVVQDTFVLQHQELCVDLILFQQVSIAQQINIQK